MIGSDSVSRQASRAHGACFVRAFTVTESVVLGAFFQSEQCLRFPEKLKTNQTNG